MRESAQSNACLRSQLLFVPFLPTTTGGGGGQKPNGHWWRHQPVDRCLATAAAHLRACYLASEAAPRRRGPLLGPSGWPLFLSLPLPWAVSQPAQHDNLRPIYFSRSHSPCVWPIVVVVVLLNQKSGWLSVEFTSHFVGRRSGPRRAVVVVSRAKCLSAS